MLTNMTVQNCSDSLAGIFARPDGNFAPAAGSNAAGLKTVMGGGTGTAGRCDGDTGAPARRLALWPLGLALRHALAISSRVASSDAAPLCNCRRCTATGAAAAQPARATATREAAHCIIGTEDWQREK